MTIAPTSPSAAARRRGVGLVAFIASIASFVLGGIAIWVAGMSIARALRLTDYPNLIQDTEAQVWESVWSVAFSGIWLLLAWLLHALLALWALVQGIVAVALDRGRLWGAIAIAVACLAWMPLTWLTQEAIVAGLLGLVPFVG